jgi:hypothetical protein
MANQQTQSQIDYLPALDISINQAKQQSTTLHIGTHILSESSKDNTQTHYQLNSHLLFVRVAVAFLLHLGFVFTCDNGSAAIGVVVFVTEGLGFVVAL